MTTAHHYRGFTFALDPKGFYAVTLEGVAVADVESIPVGQKLIDFYHNAASASFNAHQRRVQRLREDEIANAGPEPELAKGSRPSVAWVKWYRSLTGCCLSEAHAEGVRRMNEAASS